MYLYSALPLPAAPGVCSDDHKDLIDNDTALNEALVEIVALKKANAILTEEVKKLVEFRTIICDARLATERQHNAISRAIRLDTAIW